MKVFRLCRNEWSGDMSGLGAERSGGRWNSKGVPMLYTSGSQALCFAEVAVNLPFGILPADFVLVTYELPESRVVELQIKNLPPDWRTFPHPLSTREIGDRFIKTGRHLIMKVPSVVVPNESNYLINPRHPEAINMHIASREAFDFDRRLLRKLPAG